MPRCHSSKEVGCKCGDAALERQVVAEKSDGLNLFSKLGPTLFLFLATEMAGGSRNGDGERRARRRTAHSRGIGASLAHIRSLVPIPIGSFLALDAT